MYRTPTKAQWKLSRLLKMSATGQTETNGTSHANIGTLSDGGRAVQPDDEKNKPIGEY
jgi:hypothetical protein